VARLPVAQPKGTTREAELRALLRVEALTAASKRPPAERAATSVMTTLQFAYRFRESPAALARQSTSKTGLNSLM
jgi:hypothetical protein